MATYTFTIPRRADGRYYIHVVRQDEDGEVAEFDLGVQSDGSLKTYATPADAWDVAMAYKREVERASR